MAVLGKLLRSGTKVGIVGAAYYYTAQSGLWEGSAQTEQLYKDLYKTVAPYMKQHTVLDVPEIPKVSDYTRVMCNTWNSGVIASTDFIMNLPTHITDMAESTYDKINELVSDPKPPTA